jgi:hypothetical protein
MIFGKDRLSFPLVEEQHDPQAIGQMGSSEFMLLLLPA